jgi:hypothetical protein
MQALMIAGAIKAIGSISSGNAAANASKYNARVAEQNAGLATSQGQENARLRRVEARKFIGASRAAYGASGVTTEGSPLDALEESIYTSEMDAMNEEYQGKVEAANYRSQAKLYRATARNQRIQGYIGAASSLADSYSSTLKPSSASLTFQPSSVPKPGRKPSF